MLSSSHSNNWCAHPESNGDQQGKNLLLYRLSYGHKISLTQKDSNPFFPIKFGRATITLWATSPNHRTKAAIGSSESGTLGGIRTHNIMLLRHAPLPIGLRGQMVSILGIEPRLPTRQVGVLPLNYTLKMVGLGGFEPPNPLRIRKML
jgi:hypothetical protein